MWAEEAEWVPVFRVAESEDVDGEEVEAEALLDEVLEGDFEEAEDSLFFVGDPDIELEEEGLLKCSLVDLDEEDEEDEAERLESFEDLAELRWVSDEEPEPCLSLSPCLFVSEDCLQELCGEWGRCGLVSPPSSQTSSTVTKSSMLKKSEES